MRLIIILAGTLWLASASAQISAPLDDALKIISERNPVVYHVKLDEVQTRDVVAWYNRQDPPGKEKFNIAVVVKHKDGSIGLLLGNDGLISQAMIVPHHFVIDLMQAIIGDNT